DRVPAGEAAVRWVQPDVEVVEGDVPPRAVGIVGPTHAVGAGGRGGVSALGQGRSREQENEEESEGAHGAQSYARRRPTDTDLRGTFVWGAPRRPVAVGEQSAHAGQCDHAGDQSVLSVLMRYGFDPSAFMM